MTHWGWYWKVKRRHTPKQLCEWYTCLDSFELFKDKNLASFKIVNEKFTAKGSLEGEQFIVTVGNYEYIIPVEKQSCQFGGYRYYLRCPASTCNRRMRKLYCYHGLFLCRKCLKLGYYTQRVISPMRYCHMRKKTEATLEKAGGHICQKPKWMHRKTYEKLRKRYWEYELKSEEALLDELAKIFGIYP